MPEVLTLNAAGDKVEFFSLLDIARMSGRSKNSLVKLTSRGLLPQPNFRKPKRDYTGITIAGQGLYSASLVPHILKFLSGIKRTKPVDLESRVLIHQEFAKEKEYLLSLLK